MAESAAVLAALDDFRAVVVWIEEHVAPLNLNTEGRQHQMVYGCLDLALEHQAAIYVLASQGLWGSALALLRLLFESVIRGVWLAGCAQEPDLDEFERNGLKKHTFAKLIDDIEAKCGHRGRVLARIVDSSWGTLNDFTHCGYQHVVRRNSRTETGSKYKDKEKNQAINFATGLGLFAATQLADTFGYKDVVQASLARAEKFACDRDARKQKESV
jgi:hypothetical protein